MNFYIVYHLESDNKEPYKIEKYFAKSDAWMEVGKHAHLIENCGFGVHSIYYREESAKKTAKELNEEYGR